MSQSLITQYLLSFSLFFAAVTGLLKWGKIRNEDKPIIVGWWLVIINETVRFITILLDVSTLATYNTYILPLMWLYIWQFRQWKVILPKFTWALMLALSLLWFMDYFVMDGYHFEEMRYRYRLALSLTFVVLSVTSMNMQIIKERGSLIKNHRFLICLGITIFYTYRVFVDVFFLKELSVEFKMSMGKFNSFLLQIYYLLLFLAALWIPRKKNFLRQS
jgi:hypothetical protein